MSRTRPATGDEVLAAFRSLTTAQYQEWKVTDQARLRRWEASWLAVYAPRIVECACCYRLPPWLLASVVLGEVTAMTTGERTAEFLGLGSSVGLAQLTVDTAIKYGLTPTAARYFDHMARVARRTPTQVGNARLRQRALIRIELLDPAVSICASARYLSQLLSHAHLAGRIGRYTIDRTEPWGVFDFSGLDMDGCPIDVAAASQHPDLTERRIRVAKFFGAAHNDDALSGFRLGIGLTQGENAGNIADDLIGFGFITRFGLEDCECPEPAPGTSVPSGGAPQP
ncbi:MAG: hypothetical protein D6701_12770, partial [Gemmatimonadetes bacterium]